MTRTDDAKTETKPTYRLTVTLTIDVQDLPDDQMKEALSGMGYSSREEAEEDGAVPDIENTVQENPGEIPNLIADILTTEGGNDLVFEGSDCFAWIVENSAQVVSYTWERKQ